MLPSMRTILEQKLCISHQFSIRDYLYDDCKIEDISLRKWLTNLNKQDTLIRRFIPHLHGFNFVNDFEYKFLIIDCAGLCGGMSYAALDFFLSYNKSIPLDEKKPVQVSWLFKYLYDQQKYSVNGVWPKAVNYLLNLDPNKISNTRNGCKRGGDIYNTVRALIEFQPRVLILIPHAWLEFGQWHQVLAVGCSHSNNSDQGLIHVYDSKNPGKECVLRVTDEAIKVYALDCYGEYNVNHPVSTWGAYKINDDYSYTEPPPNTIINLEEQDCRNWQPDPGRRIKYTGSNLKGADFTGNNKLNNLDFFGSNLERANLMNASAESCNFSSCNLTETKFENANLNGSFFDGASGTGISFDNALLHDVSLCACYFYGAKFTEIDAKNITMHSQPYYGGNLLPNVADSKWRAAKITADSDKRNYFSFVDLSRADFSSSIIAKTLFNNCKLLYANFRDAELSNVSFVGGCDIYGNCSQAIFGGEANLNFVDFTNVKLINTNFRFARIENSCFRFIVDAEGIDFSNAVITNLDILHCEFHKPGFSETNIFDLRFLDTSLTEPDFSNSTITHGIFETGSISGAKFTGAKLSDVVFKDMTESEFNSCNWDNVILEYVVADDADVQDLLNNL